MPLRTIRPGLPTSSALTVTQLPCVAKLDQNESPLDLPPELKTSFVDELAHLEWNRYPQPAEYRDTKERFAKAMNLDPDRLSLTAGCDQAIQGAHFVAGGPGRRALVFEPTYPMLAHAGILAGTEVVRRSLGPEYTVTGEAIEPDIHLLLIASPNNPTGSSIPTDFIRAACEREMYVFIDEAYFDLSRKTVANLLDEYPNLMIGRSCSKSLLAGMRLGYTISHPEVALRLDQLLTAPYHLSHAQLLIARRFAEVRPHVEAAADATIAEREHLHSGLREMGLKPLASETNFILLPVDDAAGVAQGLAERGIRVRYAPKLAGLERYVRITVGSPEHNALLLRELKALL